MDLIATARRLLGAGPIQPSQSDLRRAISTAYYALFDALGRLCADEIVGNSAAERLTVEWVKVYRALNHGRSESALDELDPRRRTRSRRDQPTLIDPAIDRFCEHLERLRVRRTEADYDPRPLDLRHSDVGLLINESEQAITALASASPAQRRTLAFACILPKR